MELIINLTLICIVLLALMQGTRTLRMAPDRLSGREFDYSKFLIFAFGFALVFVAAFREGFQDTGVYKGLYEQIGTEFENAFDPDFVIQDHGFNLLMVFLNWIDPDAQFLIIVTSAITLIAYVYVTSKYAEDVPFSLLLLLCTSFISAMNGIRQVLAGAFMILALPWLRDRKMIPYMLLAWFASTFHASAIIMIPLYFVISGKRLNIGVWVFLALVVMCFAASSLAYSVMGAILEDTVYEEYLENESKMGMMRLLVEVVPVIVTVLFCNIQGKNRFAGNRDDDPRQRLTDILINMQIVSFGFTALGLQMVYFARISMYFSCVLPLLLPVTIEGSFNSRSAKTVKRIAIAMYLFYYVYQIYTYEMIDGWSGMELVI